MGDEEHQGLSKTSVDPVTLRSRIQNLLQDGVLVDICKNKILAREKWGVDHWKELIILSTPLEGHRLKQSKWTRFYVPF